MKQWFARQLWRFSEWVSPPFDKYARKIFRVMIKQKGKRVTMVLGRSVLSVNGQPVGETKGPTVIYSDDVNNQ